MLKKQNGITLIALIITVIVMLILVGVTINVALNGGLFQKAEYASEQMQIEAEKEELLSAVVAAIGNDGKIKFGEIQLPTGWSKVAERRYRSPKGNIYEVDPNGKIEYIGSGNSSGGEELAGLELMKTYFLGAIDDTTGERPGINLTTEETVIAEPTIDKIMTAAPSEIKFKDNDVISDAYDNMSVTSMGNEGEGYYVYVTYKGMIYKVIVGSDFVTDDITVAIEDVGVLGKYVQYEGKLWRVLYDEGEYGEGAQLISADTLEVDSVYLGYNDSIINWSDPEVIAEANKFSTDNPSETEVLSYVEKAIYSYNHAIENLNTKCASLITDNSKITAVRSVGSNPSSPNSEAGDCSLEILKTWPENNATYSAGTFYGIGKDTDENYLTDYERMGVLGISKSDNSEHYWLASRLVEEHSDRVDFRVRYVSSSGNLGSNTLWYVDSSSANYYYDNYGVRPVVSLKSGVLKEAIESDSTKDGSISNAYVID